MYMNVLDRLPSVFSGIDHSPITFGEPLGLSNFRCSPMEVPKQLSMFLLRMCDRGNVFARNNKDVDRRLGLEIRKRVAQVILVNGL